MGGYQRIGEILVRNGKITPAQLDAALESRRNSRQRMGQVITQMGFATELDVAECLAEQFGFDMSDVSDSVRVWFCSGRDGISRPIRGGRCAIDGRASPGCRATLHSPSVPRQPTAKGLL